MAKMTKAQKFALQNLMVARMKVAIEKDVKAGGSDDFWQAVADALGHGDVSKTEDSVSVHLGRISAAATQWLSRLPEVE